MIKASEYNFPELDTKYYLAWHPEVGHGFYYRVRTGEFRNSWVFWQPDSVWHDIPKEEIKIITEPST